MLAASDAAAIRVTFVTAWSGVGKTTTGDFLGEYCGARHLDGDDDMRRPSVPECKAATAGLIEAFSDFWFKEKAAPVALWHPYYQMLVNRVQVACAEGHPHIVVSISVYRREVRDFLRKRLQIAGTSIDFLKLECDVDVVVRGAIGRLEDYLKISGKTVEEHWGGPSQFPGITFAERYGAFSFESFKKMQLELYLSGMEPFAADEPADYIVVDVSSRDAAVFDLVRGALKLAPREAGEVVDTDKLKGIQTARWKAMEDRLQSSD